MQQRYYDLVIGRFYSNDPVESTEHMSRGNSAAHGFNRYAYANNNPYKFTDPDGQFALLGGAIGAAVGLISSTGMQLYQNGGDFSKLNTGTIMAATTPALAG
jgi:RHS repeat-associated protein